MKLFNILLLSFIFIGLNGQKGKTPVSKWHKDDRIELSDFISIRKTGLHYCISNDINNLYIDLIIEKQKVQDMILKNGLIIWINLDSKTIKKMGVRYPMGSQNRSIRNKAFQPGNENIQGNNTSPLLMANAIELIGFTGEVERHFSADNVDNFRGAIRNNNDGELYYRLIMPIEKLPLRNSREYNGAMPFFIGIEYGFSSDNNNQNQKIAAPQSYDYQSGGTRNGTNAKRKPGSNSDKYKQKSSTYEGTNAKSRETPPGSELYWIKDVRLATSK